MAHWTRTWSVCAGIRFGSTTRRGHFSPGTQTLESAFNAAVRLGFWLGWALFTLWHVPLALSVGITFDHGAVALIGGAALLGLFWTWIAWRTGSVFYVSIAHGLTNIFAFWVLFDRNGFAGA